MISLGLLAVFSWQWGTTGAAASRVVYGLCWIGLYIRFLHGLIGYEVGALLRIYFRSALATGMALVPLALTYDFWTGPADISLPVLAGAALSGVACWMLTLIAVRHPALDDLLGLVHHLPVARLLPARLQAALQR